MESTTSQAVDNFAWLGSVFSFFNNNSVMGVSLTTLLCVCIILSAVVLFIRGNK